MNDTEIIKEMYRQYWKYMIAKNETGLRGMMSADYYLMHMKVLAAVYGGGRHKWRLRGDYTLKKENGEWKLTSSKASTY